MNLMDSKIFVLDYFHTFVPISTTQAGFDYDNTKKF